MKPKGKFGYDRYDDIYNYHLDPHRNDGYSSLSDDDDFYSESSVSSDYSYSSDSEYSSRGYRYDDHHRDAARYGGREPRRGKEYDDRYKSGKKKPAKKTGGAAKKPKKTSKKKNRRY